LASSRRSSETTSRPGAADGEEAEEGCWTGVAAHETITAVAMAMAATRVMKQHDSVFTSKAPIGMAVDYIPDDHAGGESRGDAARLLFARSSSGYTVARFHISREVAA
jgi:hypothetical protein